MSLLWMRCCLILGSGIVAAAVAAEDGAGGAADRELSAADTAIGEQSPAELEELVVTAHPLSTDGLSEPVTVLEGAALERAAATSIGATVGRQAGVHSASFGEAVGRPVIHGLGGARVRVMEDGLDTMDVSVTSGDHAVAVEPSLAEQVEILRGPSTLLYGSGAIGGVVQVLTGRIPKTVPEAVAGRFSAKAADNANAKNLAARVDGGAGAFAWHVDVFRRTAGDYDIPGHAESAQRRAAEEHDEDEEHGHDEDEEHGDEDDEHEDEPAPGILIGSDADGRGGAVGLSWVGERGFAGVSVSQLRYDYGLPGHVHAHAHEDEHGHDEDDEEGHDDDDHAEEGHDDDHDDEDAEGGEGSGTLDMEQTRFDFKASVEQPFPALAFERLNVNFGHNDYSHLEIEANGEVGTRFSNSAFEGRVELVHGRQDNGLGWRGTLGAQIQNRDFSAIGEEAFVPPVETASEGLFWVGERPLGSFDLETGVRWERVRHSPTRGAAKGFTVFAGSAGLVTQRGAFNLGMHASYSSRAPSSEELYSNGPHLAVGSFEIGSDELDVEKSRHVAVKVAWRGERGAVSATAYSTAFSDHILMFATGAMEDDLPVLRYDQMDAAYRGLDVTARRTVADYGAGTLAVSAMFDTVSASIDKSSMGRDVPRLPPRRFGLGMHLRHGPLDVDLEYTRVASQNRVAAFELPTDGYEDVRLDVGFDLRLPNDAPLRLSLRGRNLTDDEQRHHSSIIKDVAPAPGRTIELGARVSF